jgi:hypothetical protein
MRNEKVETRVAGLDKDKYNPFAASEEELLAAALDEAGLLQPSTTINGLPADDRLQSYIVKRSRYQEVLKIGALLVRRGVLQDSDLRKALELQQSRPRMRLGEAMVALGLCSGDEIDRTLDEQAQIREGMEDLDKFRKQINTIKGRLKRYF